MKKILGVLLVVMLVVSLGTVYGANTPEKPVVLRVAVMPLLISLGVDYVVDKGWDKETGFKIETIMFSSGAPMNEALGGKLWDVATIGTAAVNTLAIYDAKYITSQSNAAGGIEIFARPDSPIVKQKGFNPTFPAILGNPESVRGKQILYPIGTIAQLNVDRWLEKVGVKEKEVTSVNMEWPQAYQAFLAGQGDLVELNPPLSFKARDNGWINVGNLPDLKVPQFDNIVASKDAYETKKALLIKFVKLVLRANAEMRKDPDLEAKRLLNYYKINGQTIDEKNVMLEVKTRPLLIAEDLKKMNTGDALKMTAEFLASVGKLQTEKLPIIEKNLTTDILKEALK